MTGNERWRRLSPGARREFRWAIAVLAAASLFALLLCLDSFRLENEAQEQLAALGAFARNESRASLGRQAERFLLQTVIDRSREVAREVAAFQRQVMTPEYGLPAGAGPVVDPVTLTAEDPNNRIERNSSYGTYVTFERATWVEAAAPDTGPARHPAAARQLAARVAAGIPRWKQLQQDFPALLGVRAEGIDGAGLWPAQGFVPEPERAAGMPAGGRNGIVTPQWCPAAGDPYSRGEAFTFALPTDGGTLRFVLAVRKLQDSWFALKAFPTALVGIVDNGERVLVAARSDPASAPDSFPLVSGTDLTGFDGELAGLRARLLAGEQGITTVVWRGTEYLAAFAPMEIPGWSFTVVQRVAALSPHLTALDSNLARTEDSARELLEHHGSRARRLALALLLPIILLAGGGWYFTNRTKSGPPPAGPGPGDSTPA